MIINTNIVRDETQRTVIRNIESDKKIHLKFVTEFGKMRRLRLTVDQSSL